MPCDAVSLETLLGIDGLARLSEREVMLALAAFFGSSLTAQQAITLAAANKYASLSDRQLDEVLLAVLCVGGGGTPCVAPLPPTAFAVSSKTSTTVTFNIGFPIPTPTNGYIILFGTVNGGPYPNSQSFPTSPFTVTGLTPNTTYFFVVQSNNGFGCVSSNSAQATTTTNP